MGLSMRVLRCRQSPSYLRSQSRTPDALRPEPLRDGELSLGLGFGARAISASRSITHCSSRAMLLYEVLASAARPGRAAHGTAINAKVPDVIVLTVFRFIDFPLRYGFQYTFETYDD